MLTRQNAIGFAIMALVMRNLPEIDARSLFIESYLNGREAGFSLNILSRNAKVIVCHDRHSCNPVVYHGHNFDFGMNNQLSDKLYAEAKHFDSVDEASKFAVSFLLNAV